MTNRKRRNVSETIEEYSQSISSDGVTVRTKCYRIVEEQRSRLEIQLDAAGQRATVDVSTAIESRLESIMKQAAHGFAASIAARLENGRL